MSGGSADTGLVPDDYRRRHCSPVWLTLKQWEIKNASQRGLVINQKNKKAGTCHLKFFLRLVLSTISVCVRRGSVLSESVGTAGP